MSTLININTNGELLSAMVILSQIMKNDNFYKVVESIPARNMSCDAQHKVVTIGKFTSEDDLTIEFYAYKNQKLVDFYIGEKDGTNTLLNIGHPALKHDIVSRSPFAADVAGMVIDYLSKEGLVAIKI